MGKTNMFEWVDVEYVVTADLSLANLFERIPTQRKRRFKDGVAACKYIDDLCNNGVADDAGIRYRCFVTVKQKRVGKRLETAVERESIRGIE